MHAKYNWCVKYLMNKIWDIMVKQKLTKWKTGLSWTMAQSEIMKKLPSRPKPSSHTMLEQ